MSEAKRFQDWLEGGGVSEGDVFICVDNSRAPNTYTKGKKYIVINNPRYHTLSLTDNWQKDGVVSSCPSTASTFIKKQKEEKKMNKMLKANWSLEWSKDNAAVIVKTLDALGIPVYKETLNNPVESQSEYTYLGESRGDICGQMWECRNHFKHLEDFLAWYFKPEKTPEEIEAEEKKKQLEELDAKIKEIQAIANKLKEEV